MLVGIVALARATHLQYVEDPATQIVSGPAGYVQKTVTAQLGETVFGNGSILLYLVGAVTALILFLAANTAFNGFPVLGSILAQDRYLPRQLHTRGDRLAFSNGIVFLAVAAMVLIVAFQAEVTRLIQLYIVGVFVSFTLSQAGMMRHWNRLLRTERDPRPAAPDVPVPGDQRLRHGAHRRGADRRAGHQVPARRVDRDRRDAGHLRRSCWASSKHYDTGRRRAAARPTSGRCCPPATTPSCWSARCTCRPCGRSRTPRRPGRTRSPR